MEAASSPTPRQAAKVCAAQAAADEADPSSSLSLALQEALGITKTGTCLRHVNCPVLLKDNKVVSCRVCFSEEKSVGIRQRKSFAAVVNQLHRIADDAANKGNDDEAKEQAGSGDGNDAEEKSSTAAENGGAAAANDSSASLLQQPMMMEKNQTLESIMKRLNQVQNWMVRQKEKEVTSLQLTIQRLEQNMKEQEATVAEQKDTIRALRRTIQQDLKIIKTMATQKERELEAEKLSSQQNSQFHLSMSTANSGGVDDGEDDDDEDAAAIMYVSPVRKSRAAAPELGGGDDRFGSPSKQGGMIVDASPQSFGSGASPLASLGSPPSMQRSDPPLEKFAKRRGKKNLLSEGGPASLDMQQQHRVPPPRRNSSRSLDASVTIPEESVLKDLEDDDDHTDDEQDRQQQQQQPRAIYISSGGGIPSSAENSVDEEVYKPRSSEYWSDEDVNLANDPSKLFASFRGGLLDIPKSPPPAHHNREKQKLKLKVKLDRQGQVALKLPSMRHIGRNHSGISTESGESLDMSGMQGSGKAGIPLNLLASQLQAAPSLDHSTHTQRTTCSGEESPAQQSPAPVGASSSSNNKQSGPQPPPPPLSLLGGTDDDVGEEEDLLLGPKASDKVEGGSNASAAAGGAGMPILVEQMNESTAEINNDDNALFTVTRASCQDRYGDPGFYTGTVRVAEGLPHGQGTMNYESGRVYEGEWKAGHWNGKGSLLNPNGDRYEGEFVFDARHGQGTYKWDNGDVYVGSFSQDKRHGHGKFDFHNGNVYEGEFVDGMFEGFGKYVFSGGSYEGEWKAGRYEGRGELCYANGGKYTGEFRNSVAHGFGVEISADGEKRRGVWEDGQPAEPFQKSDNG